VLGGGGGGGEKGKQFKRPRTEQIYLSWNWCSSIRQMDVTQLPEMEFSSSLALTVGLSVVS
jgi:hypothetical protein